MDDLHESIAAYLRSRRKTPAPSAAPTKMACRFCGCSAQLGEGPYHAQELREAGSCQHCHAARLAQDARAPATKRHMASSVAARCRECGGILPPTDGDAFAERMRAKRICEDCFHEATDHAREFEARLAEGEAEGSC